MKTSYIIDVLTNGYRSDRKHFEYFSKEAMAVDFAKLQQKYQTTTVETRDFEVEGLEYHSMYAKGGKCKHGKDIQIDASESVETERYIMA